MISLPVCRVGDPRPPAGDPPDRRPSAAGIDREPCRRFSRSVAPARSAADLDPATMVGGEREQADSGARGLPLSCGLREAQTGPTAVDGPTVLPPGLVDDVVIYTLFPFLSSFGPSSFPVSPRRTPSDVLSDPIPSLLLSCRAVGSGRNPAGDPVWNCSCCEITAEPSTVTGRTDRVAGRGRTDGLVSWVARATCSGWLR